jgi:hypothetical protein
MKRPFEVQLAERGIVPSECTDDEQVGESRHSLHVVPTASPLLDALLEGKDVPLGDGSRASKLQRMEKLVELQTSRLEDIIRSYQECRDAASLQAHDVCVGTKASEETIKAGQRELSASDCKTRGCPLEAIVGAGLCLEHAAQGNRYPLLSSCSSCGKTVLGSMSYCGMHSPAVPSLRKIN